MDKAIGFVEYKTVPTGILAADRMAKTSNVEIIQAQTVCPGKYIVLLCGSLSAVNAAIENGKMDYEENVIDSFILGNPHESIYAAMTATAKVEKVEALGVIETFTSASVIVAADKAAKTAKVNLIEIRVARGMCGKSYVIMSGELAAVQASVDAASIEIGKEGMLLDKCIIPNPDEKIWEKIL